MPKEYARAAVLIRRNASEKSIMRAELKVIKAALKALNIDLNVTYARHDFDRKRCIRCSIEVKVTKNA